MHPDGSSGNVGPAANKDLESRRGCSSNHAGATCPSPRPREAGAEGKHRPAGARAKGASCFPPSKPISFCLWEQIDLTHFPFRGLQDALLQAADSTESSGLNGHMCSSHHTKHPEVLLNLMEQSEATGNRHSNLTAQGWDRLCSPGVSLLPTGPWASFSSPPPHLSAFPPPTPPLNLLPGQTCEAVLSGGRRKNLTSDPSQSAQCSPPFLPVPFRFISCKL